MVYLTWANIWSLHVNRSYTGQSLQRLKHALFIIVLGGLGCFFYGRTRVYQKTMDHLFRLMTFNEGIQDLWFFNIEKATNKSNKNWHNLCTLWAYGTTRSITYFYICTTFRSRLYCSNLLYRIKYIYDLIQVVRAAWPALLTLVTREGTVRLIPAWAAPRPQHANGGCDGSVQQPVKSI